MLPFAVGNASVSATTTSVNEVSTASNHDFSEIPMTHHLVPLFIMIFILLMLLLASLYDCKVNRDCFRKYDEDEDLEAPKPEIYLYDGRTGESRPSHRP